MTLPRNNYAMLCVDKTIITLNITRHRFSSERISTIFCPTSEKLSFQLQCSERDESIAEYVLIPTQVTSSLFIQFILCHNITYSTIDMMYTDIATAAMSFDWLCFECNIIQHYIITHLYTIHCVTTLRIKSQF